MKLNIYSAEAGGEWAAQLSAADSEPARQPQTQPQLEPQPQHEPQPQPRPQPQLQSLQILRALAASSVVYYHIGRTPVFGSFGVDLFFVLSGFVIAMIACSEASPALFAVNRVTRVAPLYWILTAAMFVLAAIAPLLLTSTTADVGAFLKSILFIPYFKSSGALQPMLGVGWTLNYEMLFYALATLSLIFWRKSLFPYSITALVAAGWILGRSLNPHSAYGEFLGSDLPFEFVLGIVAWNIKDWAIWRRFPRLPLIALITGLYGLMAYFETISAGYHLLSFGVPALLIVIGAYHLESTLQLLPAWILLVLVHIGDASYATYLSHLYCVDFAKRILSRYLGDSVIHSAAGVVAILLASLLVGSVVYVLIDKPAVRVARKATKILRQHMARRM
jgi:exopolysaccharide production protein ExoZ